MNGFGIKKKKYSWLSRLVAGFVVLLFVLSLGLPASVFAGEEDDERDPYGHIQLDPRVVEIATDKVMADISWISDFLSSIETGPPPFATGPNGLLTSGVEQYYQLYFGSGEPIPPEILEYAEGQFDGKGPLLPENWDYLTGEEALRKAVEEYIEEIYVAEVVEDVRDINEQLGRPANSATEENVLVNTILAGAEDLKCRIGVIIEDSIITSKDVEGMFEFTEDGELTFGGIPVPGFPAPPDRDRGPDLPVDMDGYGEAHGAFLDGIKGGRMPNPFTGIGPQIFDTQRGYDFSGGSGDVTREDFTDSEGMTIIVHVTEEEFKYSEGFFVTVDTSPSMALEDWHPGFTEEAQERNIRVGRASVAVANCIPGPAAMVAAEILNEIVNEQQRQLDEQRAERERQEEEAAARAAELLDPFAEDTERDGDDQDGTETTPAEDTEGDDDDPGGTETTPAEHTEGDDDDPSAVDTCNCTGTCTCSQNDQNGEDHGEDESPRGPQDPDYHDEDERLDYLLSLAGIVILPQFRTPWEGIIGPRRPEDQDDKHQFEDEGRRPEPDPADPFGELDPDPSFIDPQRDPGTRMTDMGDRVGPGSTPSGPSTQDGAPSSGNGFGDWDWDRPF